MTSRRWMDRMLKFFDSAARCRERLSPTDPNDELCCVFAQNVLIDVYGRDVIVRAPDSMWRIWQGENAWSPVLAAKQAGIASALTLPPTAGRPLVVGAVHLCQGWRGQPFAPGVTGHTWLWYAATERTGYRLDSAGAPYRTAPGAECRLTTWAELVAPYAGGVAVAALRMP
jgi:hypothetical protein